jgi:hypothetical protein
VNNERAVFSVTWAFKCTCSLVYVYRISVQGVPKGQRRLDFRFDAFTASNCVKILLGYQLHRNCVRVLGNCSVFVIGVSMGNDCNPVSSNTLPTNDNKAVQIHCVCVRRYGLYVFLLHFLPSSTTNYIKLNFPYYFIFPTEECNATKLFWKMVVKTAVKATNKMHFDVRHPRCLIQIP